MCKHGAISLLLSGLCLGFSTIAGAHAMALEKEELVHDLLSSYCLDCHDDTIEKGDLNLESMLQTRPLVRNLDAWRNVMARVEHRDMPPAEKPQPSDDERAAILDWLEREVVQFDYMQVKHPGHEPIRRLTHLEFIRTASDLLHADFDLLELFPTDLSGASGFDNTANTLFVQPMLMERYLSVVDRMVDLAFPGKEDVEIPWDIWARIAGMIPDQSVNDEPRIQAFLKGFLTRAFRRPAGPEDLARYILIFDQWRQSGMAFDEAMRNLVTSVLVSPAFIFKIEMPAESADARRIDAWELASRLSYFLWATMPDKTLFRLAAENRLHHPHVLDAQIDRMLEDPRADTLGEVFAAQWLGFDDLGTRIRMDPIDNPWCTDSLMQAMKAETATFFLSLVRGNQPISRLLDADYTYINEEVAKLYRIEGVQGPHLRRVSLEGTVRAGLLGQGSILAVTAFPYRTSPVVRGKWVLETLLGTPPPHPPPNVSELDEAIEENRKLTPREKLEMHRNHPKCAGCHEQMDPIGLSLEHFDWFGRWRPRLKREPIDATGKLPDGTHFEGLSGLKRVLLEKRLEDLVRQTVRKMLAYALGRSLEYYDERTVRVLTKHLAGEHYRFRELVRGIVHSAPFQFKLDTEPHEPVEPTIESP